MHRIDVSNWHFETDKLLKDSLLKPVHQMVADVIVADICERFEDGNVFCSLMRDEDTGLPYVEFDLDEDGIPLRLNIIGDDLAFVDHTIEWFEECLKTLRAKRAEKEKLAEPCRL